MEVASAIDLCGSWRSGRPAMASKDSSKLTSQGYHAYRKAWHYIDLMYPVHADFFVARFKGNSAVTNWLVCANCPSQEHTISRTKANGDATGAKPPQGIEATMALTNPNDLKVRYASWIFRFQSGKKIVKCKQMEIVSEVAFEMLDVNKEGVLGKKQAPVATFCQSEIEHSHPDLAQARDFLRCAGWCLPDDELDAMLTGRVSSSNLE